MESKRIIPQFLLSGKRLVKGVNFRAHVDVGDPVSQSMIYDAQGAEEILLVDIDASRENRSIPPEVIENIIAKCHLPIAVGGGVRSVEDAQKLFRHGADKIVVNSGALEVEGLVEKLAREFGFQSILVSLDVLFSSEKGDWEVYLRSGTKGTRIMIREALQHVIASGAGEILLTSIDREGTLKGFDLPLYEHVQPFVTVPLIAGGGAGCYDHLVSLFSSRGVDACGLGTMLFLRDYDIVRIKAYLRNRGVALRDA